MLGICKDSRNRVGTMPGLGRYHARPGPVPCRARSGTMPGLVPQNAWYSARSNSGTSLSLKMRPEPTTSANGEDLRTMTEATLVQELRLSPFAARKILRARDIA